MEKSINDNESFSKKNINDNESMSKGLTRVYKTERIADRLVQTFDAPQSRNFFLKCAWKLSEATIWDMVEVAKRPGIKSPVKYFVRCCSKALHEAL